MLTLLRKIRKSLIDHDSNSKLTSPILRYVLYASGEIALVVIGILIALQVNNWNESRIDKRYEKIFLHEILDDLNVDKAEIAKVYERQEVQMNMTKRCMDILKEGIKDKSEFDSLFNGATMGNPTFFPKVGGYNSLLTQRGTNIIKDKVVLDHVTQLYEHFYDRIKTNGSLLDHRFTEMMNLKHEIYSNYEVSFLKEEWRDSEKTKSVLDYTYSIRQRVYFHLDYTLQEIDKTIEVLMAYLNN